MKLFLVAAALLLVQAFANPIDEIELNQESRDELMTVDFDEEDDCAAVFSLEVSLFIK